MAGINRLTASRLGRFSMVITGLLTAAWALSSIAVISAQVWRLGVTWAGGEFHLLHSSEAYGFFEVRSPGIPFYEPSDAWFSSYAFPWARGIVIPGWLPVGAAFLSLLGVAMRPTRTAKKSPGQPLRWRIAVAVAVPFSLMVAWLISGVLVSRLQLPCVNLFWTDGLLGALLRRDDDIWVRVAVAENTLSDGFIWWKFHYDRGGYPGDVRWIASSFPAWILVAPASVPLFICLWRRRALRYRQTHSLCMRCGYDLRGSTSLRCPECGAKDMRGGGRAAGMP